MNLMHTLLSFKIEPPAVFTGVVAFSMAILCTAGNANGQELTATEKAAVLEEVAKIEKTLEDGKAKNNIRVLGQLREAVGSHTSALNYYLKCLKSMEWDEKGKKETDWREWRESQDEFKDSAYARARQYQIRYMILTIQAAMLEKDDDVGNGKMLTDLSAFLKGMIAKYSDVVTHADVLRESVLSSDIAEDTKIAVTVDPPKKWSSSPLAIDSIYENTILPHYRRTRNASSLRNAWESRISQLKTIKGTAVPIKISTRAEGGAFGTKRNLRNSKGTTDRQKVREERKKKEDEAADKLAEFEKDDLPNLEWEMERDTFVFGSNRAGAARKLGSHIRSHLDHTNAQTWITELKKLASGEFKIEDYVDPEDEEDEGEA